jgi:hypothetical protein
MATRSRARGSRFTEKAFTERAIEDSEKLAANQFISPVVYVPRKLRGHAFRVTVDDLKITMEPETLAENHVRIAKADPLGGLIAAMNGQPLAEFRVQRDGTVRVEYTTLPLAERIELMKWLAARVTIRIPTNLKRDPTSPIKTAQHEYDAMIKQAVENQEADTKD